jgi:hypothetical protein
MVFTVEFTPSKEAARIYGEENCGPREDGKARKE